MKLICFDCDTTLSSIEGIDELARLRGPEAFARVEALTNDAMNGLVRMEDVFGRRMDIVRPGAREVEAVGRRYVGDGRADGQGDDRRACAQGLDTRHH